MGYSRGLSHRSGCIKPLVGEPVFILGGLGGLFTEERGLFYCYIPDEDNIAELWLSKITSVKLGLLTGF